MQKNLRPILISAKKKLRAQNFTARFANRNFENLKTTQFQTEKNLIEIAVIFATGKYFLAETIAAQDPQKKEFLEFSRPARSMKIGMSSARLSQILVNFARDENGNLPQKIYDPFCGTGSILFAAAEAKISEIFGSDISRESLNATRENLQFFREKNFWRNSDFQIFQADATKIFDQKIDAAIVCETFLGPRFSNFCEIAEAQNAREICEKILTKFFENLPQNFGGNCAVIAVPFWKLKSGDELFLKKSFECVKKFFKIEADFLFRRENQSVGRQILILKKIEN